MNVSEKKLLGMFFPSTLAAYGHYYFIVLILFPLAIFYGRQIYAPSDDMYIFLVYARNFIEGHGLTFNGMVVEGFTSVLWVFLITAIGFTGISLPQVAEGLSMISGLLALLATYQLAKSMKIQQGWLLLVPSILLAVTGDFAFYSVTGLEEVLFTALVAYSLSLVLSRPAEQLLKSGYFPALLAVMILTRPEGALFCAFLYLMLLRRETFSLIIQNGLKLVIYLLPILLWKRYYYGYWLPNTWYVKGGAGLANFGHGEIYFLFNVERYLAVVIALIVFLIYGKFTNKRLDLKPVIFPAAIVVIWLTYITVQGGDNMVGGRFFLPVLPIAYGVVVWVASRAQLKPVWGIASMTILGLSLVTGYLANPGLFIQAQSWRDAYPIRLNAGMYLHDHFPPGTVVALDPAGIIPFYSQLPTIDMLGLNNVYIAHEGKRDHSLWYAHQAGDGDYVLTQKPGIIIFTGLTLSAEPGDFISDREIWASAEFQNDYELVDWPGIGFVYARNNNK